MLTNLVTHFMMVKGVELWPFQIEWIDWGAVSIFVGVLILVLFITLADPVIRLIRLELRYVGKQQEKILEAKTNALEDQKIQNAMAQRADYEADILADQILLNARTNTRTNTRQMPEDQLGDGPGYHALNGGQNWQEVGEVAPKARRR